jgi:ABC-type transport system substrate-binding protein
VLDQQQDVLVAALRRTTHGIGDRLRLGDLLVIDFEITSPDCRPFIAAGLPSWTSATITPCTSAGRSSDWRASGVSLADVEMIRDEVMSGLALPTGMIIQPGINGYAPGLDTRLPFDPDAAKGLLAAAGYPDGFAVTLDCPNDRYINDEAICRAAAAMLGAAGIRVSVAARPMREHQPRITSKETDFYMLGFGTTTYDSLYILSYVVRSDAPYNAANYVNPKVDGLIDAISTAMVTYARDAMIEEVWRTVRDDIVLVPLHQQVIVWAMRDTLDLPVDPWNLPRFRLAQLNPATAN